VKLAAEQIDLKNACRYKALPRRLGTAAIALVLATIEVVPRSLEATEATREDFHNLASAVARVYLIVRNFCLDRKSRAS